jgi:uncharacterized membrane protein YadS
MLSNNSRATNRFQPQLENLEDRRVMSATLVGGNLLIQQSSGNDTAVVTQATGPLHLSFYQYGVLAGLTVYAVPQVLAAAFPVSALSGQVGTLVKLVRVLMLGPVVLFFALRHRGERGHGDVRPRFSITRFVPWFIIGFLLLAALRSFGVLGDSWAATARLVSGWLTVAAMAALGLGVDVRVVRRVGRPVIATVSASLLVLIGLALTLIHGLRIR